MQLGMPYLIETPEITDTVRLCEELRLDFVELNASFPACSVEKLNANALREMSQQAGIFFTLHIHEDCDPFSFEEGVRQAWLNHVEQAIRLAKACGMPTLNMHLPRGVHITLPDRIVYVYQQYRQELAQHLQDLLTMVNRAAGENGPRLCIENTGGWLPHEREMLETLLTSPRIGLTMDIGHLHGANNADLDFFLTHADRLHHMHAHDALGKKDHRCFGDGEVPLQERLALANRCGCRVVLETKTIDALQKSVGRLPEYL